MFKVEFIGSRPKAAWAIDDAGRADWASFPDTSGSIVRARLSRASAIVVEPHRGKQVPEVVVPADVVIFIARSRQLLASEIASEKSLTCIDAAVALHAAPCPGM